MFSETTSKKLAALIPRLASDQNGEVVATVAAIGRLLRKEGKDWHDFAKAAACEPTVIYKTVYREAAQQQPGKSDWLRKAEFCAGMDDFLRPNERDFVHDMTAKLKWLDDPSPKQAAWLESIYARLQRRNAANDF